MGSPASRDPYEYSEAEERQLQEQLLALTTAAYDGTYRESRPVQELLQQFHATLFLGVRDHAGRIRSRDFGSETLTFGPNRSPHRDQVPAMLVGVFQELTRAIASLDANKDDAKYEETALHIAVWVHAEIIRIHRLRTAMAGLRDC